MDRQLAERMVGAACLLAVMVLVVPAILDGNPDSGSTITHPPVDDDIDLRTHTIRLDGTSAEPPVPTPVQSEPAPPPAAASGTGPEGEPDAGPDDDPAPLPIPAVPAAAAPEPEPAATPEPPAREPTKAPGPAAASTAGDWVVQLGSFSSRANADRLAADVRSRGFAVSVEAGGGTSGTLYRVRVGPEAERAGAEALAARLADAGFKGGRVGRR